MVRLADASATMRRGWMVAAVLATMLAGAHPVRAQGPGIEGRTWRATEVAGAPVVVARPPTVVFDPAGRVSGFAGCNRFTGGYTYDLANGALAFTPLAATRMACPQPQSALEAAFFAALGKVVSASLGADGLVLVLSDTAGEPVTSFVPGAR